MKERIEKINKERGLREAQQAEEKRKAEKAQQLEEDKLLNDCVRALKIFGINTALSQVNEELLGGRGKLEKHSGIESGYREREGWDGGHYSEWYEYAQASIKLIWEKRGKHYRLEATATKDCLSDYPFTIEIYYPGCEGDYDLSLQLRHMSEGNEHLVTGGRIIEYGNVYSTVEISEAFQNKIAEICINLQKQGLL